MKPTTLIIGATGGIGSDLARRMAAAGRPLHLVARDPQRLATLAAELGASHAVADVTDADALTAAIDANPDPIQALAYCVGSIDLAPVTRVSPALMLESYQVNVVGALTAIKAALPRLEDGSSVLLYSSVAATQGFTQHAAIAAAKAGVEGLVRALAAELAPKVRVNAIAPSLTRTPLAARFTSSDTMAQAIAQLHALPRLGEASDIAALSAFLLGPEAGWITGQVYAVDGGRSTVRARG
jgi:NAD(P)-dependent dehydrogenase (short-subunit alcohol dehydrogenase family)